MAGTAENHAALMDRVYRHQRHVYDFTRKYYLFGRDRLIDQLKLKPGSRVIEVGCGTARNLVRIARRHPRVELFGLDASPQMLASAEQSIAKAGLSTRIKLIQAYAEALSPSLFGETEPFDAIIFSYSLSMIPDWKQALRSASQVLAPDGTVHIVDFGDLKGLPFPIQTLLRGWLRLFHVAPREELLKIFEQQLGTDCSPILLGDRYAFLLSCGGRNLCKGMGWPVAAESQA